MSTTQTTKAQTAPTPSAGMVDTRLEVIFIPVSDVERSLRFYAALDWKLDGDFKAGDWRGVQMTPPGSQCSIIFGKGVTSAAPGSAQGLMLVSDDLEAARTALVAAGVDASEIFHFEGPLHATGTEGRAPGPDPQGQSYRSFLSFSDPDGNGWLIQEVKTRLPGRGLGADVRTLTQLLREAEEHHGPYEASAPKHHWSDWYAGYIDARERGKTPEDSAKDAALHMQSIRH